MITFHQVATNPPFFRAVTALGELADSSNLSYQGRVVGVTKPVSVPVGTMPVASAGESIFNAAWTWTRGSMIYLNGSALSHTPPPSGFLVRMGWGLNLNTMVVDVEEGVAVDGLGTTLYGLRCRNNGEGDPELYVAPVNYILNESDGLAYRIGYRRNDLGDPEVYLYDTGLSISAPSRFQVINDSTLAITEYACRSNPDPELYVVD